VLPAGRAYAELLQVQESLADRSAARQYWQGQLQVGWQLHQLLMLCLTPCLSAAAAELEGPEEHQG
jgi:hypothetical protein